MLDLQLIAASGKIFDNHYKLIRPLSTDGGTADVWLALDMNTVKDPNDVGDLTKLYDDEIETMGLIVAIKIYRPQNALDIEGEQRFREEYMIVYNCHHTNLIHPTNFSIYEDTPYLVLPYCKLGSSDLLIGNMPNADVMWKFIGDVASGLAYLHDLKPPIIHQDIKPGNVLIDDSLNYAITDFGISAKHGGTGNGEDEEQRSGTTAYMAPERFVEGTEPGLPSDIWAFGATLCELVTGEVPFGDEGGWAQVSQKLPMPKLPDMPVNIRRLVYACLDPDPKRRPTAKEISELAQARQFPAKKGAASWMPFAIIGAAAVLLAALAFFLFTRSSGVSDTWQTQLADGLPSTEERYEEALANLDSDSPERAQRGLDVMDSLCRTTYIPAIYQVAYTYGWFSDSASVQRKRLLGIEVDRQFLPKVDTYSHEAVALFTKIMELNDSSYATINANAIYRLACYYVMNNKIYQPNYERGKRYLKLAREWAIMAGDGDLLRRIDNGLASFQ